MIIAFPLPSSLCGCSTTRYFGSVEAQRLGGDCQIQTKYTLPRVMAADNLPPSR